MYLNIVFGKFRQDDKSLSRNAEGIGVGFSLIKLSEWPILQHIYLDAIISTTSAMKDLMENKYITRELFKNEDNPYVMVNKQLN
ncbi:MAG TPA: hypothetical protein VIM42_00950 [Clostridium sp.]